MQLLLIAFSISTLVQLSYWFFFLWHFKISKGKKSQKFKELEAVSIIICLKNEAKNLGRHLSSWVDQLDDKDELILVDDFSTDNTPELLKDISSSHENVYTISCTKDRPGKKQALSDAIAFATNDIILVTDADCKVGKEWKSILLQGMSQKTDFLLAYAPFYKKSGFLNLFQRFENVLTAFQYFSYAKSGLPYMGVGRNMMFRKKVFDEAIYENDLASGDDDLLVSAKADKRNTKTCLDPKTFVYSEAAETKSAFFRQKTRHISSSVEYKTHIKFLLSTFSATQILSNLLLIFVLLTSNFSFGLILYFLKIGLITASLYIGGKRLNEGKIFRFAIILDLCLSLYYIILAFLYPFKNRRLWT